MQAQNKRLLVALAEKEEAAVALSADKLKVRSVALAHNTLGLLLDAVLVSTVCHSSALLCCGWKRLWRLGDKRPSVLLRRRRMPTMPGATRVHSS
jgi:hypothetical protein